MHQVYCLSDRAIQIDCYTDSTTGVVQSTPCELAALSALLSQLLHQLKVPAFQCIQADQSLTVLFEQPLSSIHDLLRLEQHVRQSLPQLHANSSGKQTVDSPTVHSPNRHHDIQVVYGGEAGPDLAWVAQQTGLKESDIVHLHSSAIYTVNFLGFLPGFAYLTGLPAVLELPRRNSPRSAVPAGSLAIAANYCAVYPWQSPGGWHLLGRATQPMFNPDVDDRPSMLQPGDTVRFVAVNHA